MKIKVCNIELKKIKNYICSDFYYNDRINNIKNINNILKNEKSMEIKNHIFRDLIKTNNYLSIINLTKKFYKEFKTKNSCLHTTLKNEIFKLLNDKKVLNLLIKSISKNGYIYNRDCPIVVIYTKKKYYLLDGFHRFFSCLHLKLQKIKAEVYYA